MAAAHRSSKSRTIAASSRSAHKSCGSGAIGIALAGAVFFPLVAGTPTPAHFIHGFASALIAQSILLTITFAGGVTLARQPKLPKQLTA